MNLTLYYVISFLIGCSPGEIRYGFIRLSVSLELNAGLYSAVDNSDFEGFYCYNFTLTTKYLDVMDSFVSEKIEEWKLLSLKDVFEGMFYRN